MQGQNQHPTPHDRGSACGPVRDGGRTLERVGEAGAPRGTLVGSRGVGFVSDRIAGNS